MKSSNWWHIIDNWTTKIAYTELDRWASNDAIKHYMNITEMNYQNSSKGLDLSALLNAALSQSISRLLFLDYSHYFLWWKKS